MFTGFTEKTSEFIWGLMFNNERPWFEAHKQEFLQELKRPFDELSRDTYALLQEKNKSMPLNLHISRIYRDARRLHGRGPYKDHLWFSIKSWSGLLSGPMFWFEVGAADYSWGMGFYDAAPAQMEAFRASLAAEPSRFLRIVRALKRNGFELSGEQYKRPKGDLGPELNPWYNSKRIGIHREENFGGALLTPELPQLLADDFQKLMPLYKYLCTFCREE